MENSDFFTDVKTSEELDSLGLHNYMVDTPEEVCSAWCSIGGSYFLMSSNIDINDVVYRAYRVDELLHFLLKYERIASFRHCEFPECTCKRYCTLVWNKDKSDVEEFDSPSLLQSVVEATKHVLTCLKNGE